ncbi:MAG: transporter associated domain-containing protein [bacterium]|nr:CBS domain-containing protein [Gammaproteobacteria bacterium]HIL97064.1 CBS domain-containing protein [Pseudomonadales bacterium]
MTAEGSSGDSRSWVERISRALSREAESRSELVELLRSAQRRNILDAEVLSIIEGALTVSDMQAREIMIPRSQMKVVRLDMTPEEILPFVIESGHSRFPVLADNPDDVLGILLAKDLLPLSIGDRKNKFNMRDLLRPCTAIPESKRVNILLQEFRQTKNHMAVVYDEYGGVSGIVTIEDVLEQIVGDIEDEYDFGEEDFIMKHADGSYTVKALTPVDEFNAAFGSDFSDEEFDTIGGVVTHHFGHLPKRGEKVDVFGFQFTVLNADSRRIRLLSLTLIPTA